VVRPVLLAHARLPVQLLHRGEDGSRPLAGGGEEWWAGRGGVWHV
jgi:hypothetical protein